MYRYRHACLHINTSHWCPRGKQAGFYESSLYYRPSEFEPAAERLRIARCLVIMSKAQSERSSNNGNGKNATNSTNATRDPKHTICFSLVCVLYCVCVTRSV